MAGRSLREPSGHPPYHYPALGQVSVFHFTVGNPKTNRPQRGVIARTGLIRQQRLGATTDRTHVSAQSGERVSKIVSTRFQNGTAWLGTIARL